MCPACMTAAALLTAGVTSAGGVGALVVKTFRARARRKPTQVPGRDDPQGGSRPGIGHTRS